jgi:hypothetical protein
VTGAEGGDENVAALSIETDEQFHLTVVSADVIAADAELWAMFQGFLGNDPVTAWVLAVVRHTPERDPDAGTFTGLLVSTAEWKRDPNVPTPSRLLVPIEQDEEDEGR